MLFGATGDLARRKLLPGLFHLHAAGLLPAGYRIIGSAPKSFAMTEELFEPVWNREHICYVQIDVPETLSIEGRAAFYDATGAYRDHHPPVPSARVRGHGTAGVTERQAPAGDA